MLRSFFSGLTAPPAAEWRLHVGVHKTATTHLQETLEQQRSALGALDTDFLYRPEIRPVLRQCRRRDFDFIDRRMMRHLGRLSDRCAREDLEKTLVGLQPMLTGRRRVILSEENILGPAIDILKHPIYPRLEQLSTLAQLGRTSDCHIFLSIRSFDRLLPSAYAEALKFQRQAIPLFATARARMEVRPTSWVDMIQRIRRAATHARLTIWNYDDYSRNWPAILDRLAGLRLPPIEEQPRPRRTATPSARAIARAEELTMPNSPERTARIREIFEEHPASAASPAFNPMGPEEVYRLRAQFEADLHWIDQHQPRMLLRFA